jgi:L-asparaginase
MSSTQATKPRIAIVATGGTIASTAPDSAQLADYSVSTKVQALVEAVPGLTEVAQLEFEQVCNIESHEIDDAILVELTCSVQALCDRTDIDGVVITHGTDTLEETAYFLHLTLDTQKPVVLVGAMRPGSALSADGPLNLYHAVVVACAPESTGKGVLVVMNDRIASARHVTKGHANGVDAFVPTEFGYLGLVSGRSVQYLNQSTLTHTANSEFHRMCQTESSPLPPVDVIYDHQAAGLHLYRASIDAGVRAIVLAATGQGSLSPQAQEGAALAQQAGVLMVRSTRVWQGVVRPSAADLRFGTLAAYTLNPPKARVLLRLAVTRTSDTKLIQQWFASY